MPSSRLVLADDEMSVEEQETTHCPFRHPSASEPIPPDVPVASVEPEDSAQTMSTRRITFKRPPNPVDRAEPPKRTRGDDDEDSALLSAYHHDLEKISENIKDGRGVFSRTGMPDVSDSAWLAIKTKTKTLKSEPKTDAKSVSAFAERCRQFCWSQSNFSWMEKQYNKFAAIPSRRKLSM